MRKPQRTLRTFEIGPEGPRLGLFGVGDMLGDESMSILKNFQFWAELNTMRLGLVLCVFLISESATAFWAPDFVKNSFLSIFRQTKSLESQQSFADLEASKEAEIYLKDASAFIFSRSRGAQKLKLRDSVLVGPQSEAFLVLSEAFGGGRILLGANTIITLSWAGKQNQIPRIDIKQGEITIVEVPRIASARTRAFDQTSKPLHKTDSKESSQVQLRDLLITSGNQALLLDERLEQQVISVSSDTREISMARAPLFSSTTEQPQFVIVPLDLVEVAHFEETPLQDIFASTSISASTLELEEQETLKRDIASLSESEEDLPENLQATEPKASAHESFAATTATASPTLQPANVQVHAKTQAPMQEQSDHANLGEKILEEAAPTPSPSKNLFIDTHEAKLRLFEARLKLAQRNYKDNSNQGSSLDLDLGLQATIPITDIISASAQLEVAALNFQSKNNTNAGATKAPRPVSTNLELKHQLIDNRRFQLLPVAGFGYRCTLGNSTFAAYRNVRALGLGADAYFALNVDSQMLFAPRFYFIQSSSYGFDVPVTYLLNEQWGIQLNYSLLVISPIASYKGRYQAIGAGVTFRL